MENKFREILRGGRFTMGMFSFIPSEAIVDIAGYAGLDYLIFDTEHASYDIALIERQVRAAEAANIASIVRISHPDPYLIARVLDTGVDGLMFARVSSKEAAEEAVKFCRLPPLGERGVCPGSRAGHFHFMPRDEYTRISNDVAIAVMIETKDGLDQIEDILRVPGIDGVAIGRSDLSYSMGSERDAPEVLEAQDRIVKLATSLGLGSMISAKSPEIMADFLRRTGARTYWYSTESYQIGSHFQDLVQRSQKLAAEIGAGGSSPS